MTEILAPAGDADALEAAINAGADAVYLGLTDFSARKSAANFTLDNLKEYAARAHVLGCKVYVAMNTLVKDSETHSFFDCALRAWNCGADALIIQDIFLGKILHETYPELVLHLSTQAGVCNVYGARLAKRYGFSRVILARETPLQDIKEISEILETEVFVQGALCTCFSGQCYMSSFAGGNSGNRGYCKQPCRKKYKADRKGFEEYSYKLSLSDLSVGKDIFTLTKAGVSSFKIEGRMRSAAYVGSAVKYYRDILEGNTQAIQKDFSDLKRTFNRGGYTRGYAFGQDKNLISSDIQGHAGEKIGEVGMRQEYAKYTYIRSDYTPGDGDGFTVIRANREEIGGGAWRDFYPRVKGGFVLPKNALYRAGDAVCLTSDVRLAARVASVRKKIPLFVQGSFSLDKPPKVRVSGDFGELFFEADFSAQEAKSRPFTEEDFAECFSKTDDYPFEISSSAEIEGSLFFVKSQLNAFRRDVFKTVFETLAKTHGELEQREIARPNVPVEEKINPLLAVIDRDFSSAVYKDYPLDYAILKPDDFRNLGIISDFIEKAQYYAWHKLLYLPAYSTGEDLKAISKIVKDFDGIYADGVFALEYCKEYSVALFAGTGFNLFNAYSVSECVRDGAEQFCVSKELSDKEAASAGGEAAFRLCGGEIKLMDLGHCIFAKSCSACDERTIYHLTDESGRVFPLHRYKNSCCRFEVYNYALLAHERTCRALYDFTVSDTEEKALCLSGAKLSVGARAYTAVASKNGIR